MTHRYPTRFQAKLASKNAAEAKSTSRQCAIQVAATCTDKENELRVIKTLLNAAENSYCRFHRINAAIKLFHYFEHHHYLLKNYPQVREITRTKIVEFSNTAKHEKHILNQCNHSEEYKEQCRITTAIEILMESCAKVHTLIQNM